MKHVFVTALLNIYLDRLNEDVTRTMHNTSQLFQCIKKNVTDFKCRHLSGKMMH